MGNSFSTGSRTAILERILIQSFKESYDFRSQYALDRPVLIVPGKKQCEENIHRPRHAVFMIGRLMVWNLVVKK